MRDPAYYRQQAARARRFAAAKPVSPDAEQLQLIAKDYDEIAADLEMSAAEIRQTESTSHERDYCKYWLRRSPNGIQ